MKRKHRKENTEKERERNVSLMYPGEVRSAERRLKDIGRQQGASRGQLGSEIERSRALLRLLGITPEGSMSFDRLAHLTQAHAQGTTSCDSPVAPGVYHGQQLWEGWACVCEMSDTWALLPTTTTKGGEVGEDWVSKNLYQV